VTWHHSTSSDGNFYDSCNYHDLCYGGCYPNITKFDCDSELHNDARECCFNDYPLPGDPYLNKCLDLAKVYFTAVSELGDSAYNSAVKKNCNCCYQ
jgi:hypothetical protein